MPEARRYSARAIRAISSGAIPLHPGSGRMTFSIDRAAATKCRLGETPLWDDLNESLTWIDVERPTHFSLDPSSCDVTAVVRDGTYLGSQALTGSGRLLLVHNRTVLLADGPDDEGTPLAEITAEDGLDTRLNDGRVDRLGRLWIGSMDNGLGRPLGSLYRIDGDGIVTPCFGGVIVSNTIAFAPDGRTMYFSDTRQHLTWRIPLGENGRPGERTVLHDWRDGRDRPDGACVDVDGCLWVAIFGGARIVRLTPRGEIDRQIALPVTNPTCCVFGGPDLRTLYVTSATKFLSPATLAAEPLAGALLAVEGAGQGLPEHRFDA